MDPVTLYAEDGSPNEDTIFYEVILDASGVCRNCFNRTHEVYTDWWPKHRAWEPIVKSALVEEQWESLDYRTDRVPAPFQPAGAWPAMKRACGECGLIDRHTAERPLKMGRMIECTHHLTERLEEASIPFNKDVLYDTIRDMKTDGDEHYRDDVIFATAIREAAGVGIAEYRRQQHEE